MSIMYKKLNLLLETGKMYLAEQDSKKSLFFKDETDEVLTITRAPIGLEKGEIVIENNFILAQLIYNNGVVMKSPEDADDIMEFLDQLFKRETNRKPYE